MQVIDYLRTGPLRGACLEQPPAFVPRPIAADCSTGSYRWIPPLMLALLLTACAHYPANAPLTKYDRNDGYRLENLQDVDNSGSLLVVLTFSGGGTRAAAMAYGVLEELAQADIQWEGRRTSLLTEVDIISAVSGGSYTAAYYALYRNRLFTDFEDDFLKRNVQGEIMRAILAPKNLIRTLDPRFGRINVVAEYLDQALFHGATYGDLLHKGRPFVLINASDLSLGSRFEFSQDQFDLLCADLSPFLLAHAVAASSAVPVVLSPLTLRNHAGQCGFQEPDWVEPALGDRPASARRYFKARELRSYLDAVERPFIHLLDGGLSDNTGVRALLDRVLLQDDPVHLAQSLGAPALRKVVLIMVSAETQPDLSIGRVESVPTAMQVIRNVKDIPINAHSFETVELFKTHFEDWPRRQVHATSGGDAVDFYLIEVTLEAIADEIERSYFMGIPTSFHLPSEQVDELREMAGRLLQNAPDYRRLMGDLEATAADSHLKPQPPAIH